MTKVKAIFNVNTDLSNVFKEKPVRGYPIENALAIIIRQMEVSGLRERTISDYELHVRHFIKVTNLKFIEEISAEHVYEWLSSMEVSNQTRLTRLKCLKAFFGRCFNNGWITVNFWHTIKIKVDTPVKEGAAERDINILLSIMDLTKFVDLRDAAAILMMYQTGIRIGTLSQLKYEHVNLDSNLLVIDGGIIKNHQPIYLPFDDVLSRLLGALMKQNELIKRERRVKNNYLFITQKGSSVSSSPTNNNITKRIAKYSQEFGLKNINPHALRRGFAKNLLKKGANVALISKALGHSDIAVTTRYLHLDKEEVAASLRNYLS